MLGRVLILLLPAVVTARKSLPPTGITRAESHVIYLNPNGITLRPGDNDSSHDVSSVIEAPTQIAGWDTDESTWQDTVDCMRDIYAPFDVTITEDDPGDAPHIEAVFGGAPADVGLPDNVGGVSPFTEDCAVIDRSIVFAFTDALPDDARSVCEVMAQEVAHSFGLDHEMLPSDPMTYLTYLGERTFQDEMAPCGEFGNRMCGINGSVCRTRQNSHALLAARLGTREPPEQPELASGVTNGCSAGGANRGILLALCYVLAHCVAGRRTRSRRHRSLLQRSSGDRQGRQ